MDEQTMLDFVRMLDDENERLKKTVADLRQDFDGLKEVCDLLVEQLHSLTPSQMSELENTYRDLMMMIKIKLSKKEKAIFESLFRLRKLWPDDEPEKS